MICLLDPQLVRYTPLLIPLSCVLPRVLRKEKWRLDRVKYDRSLRMAIALRSCCRCCLLHQATWWHAQKQRVVVLYLPKRYLEEHCSRDEQHS